MKGRDSFKKFIVIAAVIVFCVGAIGILEKFRQDSKVQKPYGVFLGIDSTQIKKLQPYSMVVIEPAAFEKKHIVQLHRQGKKVYGYLNVGAIEKTRPYYKRFQKLTLDAYENWPEERWIDVSDKRWQNFIVEELGEKYVRKGLDGLFIDNTDVYYQYKEEAIFQGLCNIFAGLKKQNVSIIVNGGDVFVEKMMENAQTTSLFDGINQETVFTTIDFRKKSYGR